LTESISVATS